MPKAVKKKIKLTSAVRLNAYAIASRAVEEGIAYGWYRAHKHADSPGEDTIREEIGTAVMTALSEYIQFDWDQR